jgi:ribosomal protein L37AE/L43A
MATNEDIYIYGSIGIVSSKTPSFPLSRVINETRQVSVCKTCGSSLVRKYLLAFWMPKYCINKECK